MRRIALFPYPHIKNEKEKLAESATKEDIAQLEAKITKLALVLTPRQKLRLLKQLARKKRL